MTIQKTTGGTAILVALLTLSACGPELEDLAKSAEVQAVFDDADAFRTEGEAFLEAEGYSDPATLPTTGSAAYTGFIGFDTDDVTTIGELEMTADFSGAGSISGSATNFVSDNDATYAGSLSIDNGIIDRAADLENFNYTFNADIAGTLTSEGDDFVVDGLMEGDFVGGSQEYITGHVTGNVMTNEGIKVISGNFGATQ